MNILFIASFAVVPPDPPKSRELYVEALGLPLAAGKDGEYWHSEKIAGSKHFAVWPLSQAAEACFRHTIVAGGADRSAGERRVRG